MQDKLFQKEIGQRIKELRNSYGYTQDKLAEMVDLTTDHIRSMEAGRRGVTAETLTKLKRVLMCPLIICLLVLTIGMISPDCRKYSVGWIVHSSHLLRNLLFLWYRSATWRFPKNQESVVTQMLNHDILMEWEKPAKPSLDKAGFGVLGSLCKWMKNPRWCSLWLIWASEKESNELFGEPIKKERFWGCVTLRESWQC